MTLKAKIDKKQALTELGYKAKIKVGGENPDKFLPNINCSFERVQLDEFFININASDVVVDKEKETLGAISKIKVGDREDRFYVDDDGNLEYEIILDKKPKSSTIKLDITCSPELRFDHQPKELTKAELAMPGKCYRPDDIKNSYAVRCEKRNNQYQTGKIAHIKRSWVIDANGKKSWCDQFIEMFDGVGTWEITIPEDAYKSKYPLTVGPTIGYTTVGGSNTNTTDLIAGCRFSAPSNGDANPGTLYYYASTDGGTIDTVAGVYEDNSGTVASQDKLTTADADLQYTTTAAWDSDSITWTGITASTDYWLVVNPDLRTFSYYDTTTSGYEDTEYASRNHDGTLPSTFPSSVTSISVEVSIYVEYSNDIDISAGTDTLVLTENSATVTLDADVEIEAGTDALVITGNQAEITFDTVVDTVVDELVLTGYAAEIDFDVEISAGFDTLIVSQLAAEVSLGVNIDVGTDALVLTEYAASVDVDISVDAGFDELILTSYAASVALTGGIVPTPYYYQMMGRR